MVARKCSCGIEMLEATGHPGIFGCAHCDGPCHRRCNPAACDKTDGTKCGLCNAFDNGSRRKKAATWTPPTYA